MRVVGYLLAALSLYSYATTVHAIWRLVAETKQLNTGVHFNRFWWTPAWRLHRNAYPESNLRRQIVTRFTLTFALMVAAMGCIAIATYSQLPK